MSGLFRPPVPTLAKMAGSGFVTAFSTSVGTGSPMPPPPDDVLCRAIKKKIPMRTTTDTSVMMIGRYCRHHGCFADRRRAAPRESWDAAPFDGAFFAEPALALLARCAPA